MVGEATSLYGSGPLVLPDHFRTTPADHFQIRMRNMQIRNEDRVRYRVLFHPRNLAYLASQTPLVARSFVPQEMRPMFDASIAAGLSVYATMKYLGESVLTPGSNVAEPVYWSKRQTSRPLSNMSVSNYNRKRSYDQGNLRYLPYARGTFQGNIYGKRSCHTSKRVPYVYELVQEDRNVTGDPTGLYLGTGPNMNKVNSGVWHCVIHCLLKNAGIDVVAWNANIPGTGYAIRYGVYPSLLDTGVATTSFIITPNSSADNMVTQLITSIRGFLGDNRFHKFSEIEFYRGGTTIPDATINFDNLKIKYFCSLNMLIQNRTQAGTTAAPLDETDVVSVNPLYLRYYGCYGNAMLNRAKSGPAALYTWNQSIISQPLATYATNDRNFDSTKFINGTMSKKAYVMDPGKILNLKNSFSHFKSFHTWMNILEEFVISNDSTNMSKVDVGKLSIVGIEKQLQVAGEPEIDVAFEVNDKVCFGYTYRNVTKIPSVYVE